MKNFLRVAVVGLASTVLVGTALAADMPGIGSGAYAPMHHSGDSMHSHHRRHGASLFGYHHRTSSAGRAQERHRTRLDRCENVPSRC